ncbi:hypothetical protein [Arthrobacter sp. N1]|uniref:hypothetical protein n=1 Tax=Arthrobacter sp. N1 TaxID=619291 RepID=UPI003BAE865A
MYRFMLCSLKTGRVLYEMPFTIAGSLSRLLQGFGTGTLALPIHDPACSSTWAQDVLPWRSVILVVDEHNRILWHGIPINRLRSGNGIVRYPCVTIEGYLLRRYTPNLMFEAVDQTAIAAALAGVAADAVGIPLTIDAPASRVIRDRVYADDENARLYSRLQELAAVDNGFNWTMDVTWTNTDQTSVRYVFRTGYPHLGNRTSTPEHVFELPGNVTDFEFDERWGDGDAATHARAFGDGDSEAKVMSKPVVDTVREAAGWPRLEERRSFSGVTEQHTIDAHAARLGRQLFAGQELITLAVREDAGTRLGDLHLGDTARVSISTPDVDLDAVWVVTEWSLTQDATTYSPTLARLEA